MLTGKSWRKKNRPYQSLNSSCFLCLNEKLFIVKFKDKEKLQNKKQETSINHTSLITYILLALRSLSNTPLRLHILRSHKTAPFHLNLHKIQYWLISLLHCLCQNRSRKSFHMTIPITSKQFLYILQIFIYFPQFMGWNFVTWHIHVCYIPYQVSLKLFNSVYS